MDELLLLELSTSYYNDDDKYVREKALETMKKGIAENIQTLEQAIHKMDEQASMYVGSRSGYVSDMVDRLEYFQASKIISERLTNNTGIVALTRNEYEELLKYKKDLEDLKRILGV